MQQAQMKKYTIGTALHSVKGKVLGLKHRWRTRSKSVKPEHFKLSKRFNCKMFLQNIALLLTEKEQNSF